MLYCLGTQIVRQGTEFAPSDEDGLPDCEHYALFLGTTTRTDVLISEAPAILALSKSLLIMN